jgi:hypothetical protein
MKEISNSHIEVDVLCALESIARIFPDMYPNNAAANS